VLYKNNNQHINDYINLNEPLFGEAGDLPAIKKGIFVSAVDQNIYFFI